MLPSRGAAQGSSLAGNKSSFDLQNLNSLGRCCAVRPPAIVGTCNLLGVSSRGVLQSQVEDLMPQGLQLWYPKTGQSSWSYHHRCYLSLRPTRRLPKPVSTQSSCLELSRSMEPFLRTQWWLLCTAGPCWEPCLYKASSTGQALIRLDVWALH